MPFVVQQRSPAPGLWVRSGALCSLREMPCSLSELGSFVSLRDQPFSLCDSIQEMSGCHLAASHAGVHARFNPGLQRCDGARGSSQLQGQLDLKRGYITKDVERACSIVLTTASSARRCISPASAVAATIARETNSASATWVLALARSSL